MSDAAQPASLEARFTGDGQRPLISLCIPAFNRASLLPEILDRVYAQDFADFEVVVCDDASPQQAEIRAVCERYAAQHPGTLHFHANPQTLGYDGNLRRLVELARGRYVFFLGNDDHVASGAFRAIAEGIARHGDFGVLLRAFSFFDRDPDQPLRTTRYFPGARVLPPGRDTLLTCFRRLVIISGIVMDRDLALAAASTRVDGLLFYQQWLAAHILMQKPALYLPTPVALYRLGGLPEFGTGEAERARFVPGPKSFEQELQLNRSLFDVAAAVEATLPLPGFAEDVRRDFARHAFHTLVYFAKEGGRRGLWRAYRGLWPLGLQRSPSYHAWFLLLLVLGGHTAEGLADAIRARLGYTPNLS